MTGAGSARANGRPTPAIFASAFHPHVGGVEELVRQLALEQRRRGSDTVVVTNRHPSSLPSREVVGGIDVVREPFRVPGTRPRQLAGFLAGSPLVERRLHQELARRRVDVIHVQCVSTNGYYALRAARALRLPVVVTMQGELTMDADRIYEKSAHLRLTWRRLLRQAAVITACSRYSLDEAQEVYGQPFGGRSQVVYNGIRLDEYADLLPEVRDVPYVLGLGRMVPQKGFDVLVDAFAQVAPDVPHELLLAGDGPSRAELEEQVVRLGLRERVHFLGSVGHDRALQLFAGAAAFVLSSRHEPQGIVVLEAMAAGAPVAAAAVGGVPEVVDHGVNGLLFPGSDSHGMAEALRRLLTEDGLAPRLAGAARRAASGYDWTTITDQYDELYARALSAR